MLTVSDTEEHLFSAIKRGAEGYLLKNMDPPQLFAMLEGIPVANSPISVGWRAKLLRESAIRKQATPSRDAGGADAARDRVLELWSREQNRGSLRSSTSLRTR